MTRKSSQGHEASVLELVATEGTMPAGVWAVKKEDQDLKATQKEKYQSLMARPDSGPELGLKTEGLPQSM